MTPMKLEYFDLIFLCSHHAKTALIQCTALSEIMVLMVSHVITFTDFQILSPMEKVNSESQLPY